MALRPIRLWGDPVLRTVAREVTDFDRELRTLVRDLTETMLEAPGSGLAAPQLGVGLRVFTYAVDGVVGHLVNPRLDFPSAEDVDGEEGCLSIPGLTWDLVRRRHVVATGWNQHGDPAVVQGADLLARCVQHETDHLDGVLFVDRLDPETKRAALAAIRSAEWAGEPAPAVRPSPHAVFGAVR